MVVLHENDSTIPKLPIPKSSLLPKSIFGLKANSVVLKEINKYSRGDTDSNRFHSFGLVE